VRFFGELLMLFAYFPGSGELVILLCFYGIFKIKRRESWERALCRSLAVTAVLTMIVFLTFNFVRHNDLFLRPLLDALMAIIGIYALKRGTTRFQKFAVPFAIMIFILLQWQMTFVNKETKVFATWKIEEGQRVQFIYGCHGSGLASEELVAYLAGKEKKTVILTLYPTYQWGKLHSTGLILVDGRRFRSSNSWANRTCGGPPPYPEYYFGIRGLRFSKL
jgi:hypothetical protein